MWNSDCGMQSLLPVTGDRYGIYFAGREDSVVKLGIGMAVGVLTMDVYWFTNEDFWLVDSCFVSSQARSPDTLGVTGARGMEGGFVLLKGVSGIFVELVNVFIGIFEDLQRTSEVSVVDASSHFDAAWVYLVFYLVGIKNVDHIELPGHKDYGRYE